MNDPRGFVMARITSKKKRIWNQPLFVMIRTFLDATWRTRDRRASPRKPPATQSYRASSLPQSIAEFHIQDRKDKKHQRRDRKNRIEHGFPSLGRWRANWRIISR